MLILMVPLFLVSCQAQTNEKRKEIKKEKKETANTPKVDIKVNKVYDENGNLVGYDSTYVWSYLNNRGDSVSLDADSVLSRFKPIINSQYPDFLNNYNKLFFNDSLFYHNFLEPDYFMGRWEKEMSRMNRMMQEMDSMKELFFKDHYPDLKNQKQKTKTL